ncbi:hypothetical protein ABZ554_36035, partial [Streptomyces sp. NPDC020125]|uniref:hypothetical protein n=1 Tax=Streptomyces sp. NPDC020125 TaxID=3154593 RepID=UPI0033F63B77
MSDASAATGRPPRCPRGTEHEGHRHRAGRARPRHRTVCARHRHAAAGDRTRRQTARDGPRHRAVCEVVGGAGAGGGA